MDDDKYKTQLEEVEYNKNLIKRQIQKVKRGKFLLPTGNGIVEASPGGILNILEEQLRDLEIQKSKILKEMEENEA